MSTSRWGVQGRMILIGRTMAAIMWTEDPRAGSVGFLLRGGGLSVRVCEED